VQEMNSTGNLLVEGMLDIHMEKSLFFLKKNCHCLCEMFSCQKKVFSGTSSKDS
jgi:hypothetical protein